MIPYCFDNFVSLITKHNVVTKLHIDDGRFLDRFVLLIGECRGFPYYGKTSYIPLMMDLNDQCDGFICVNRERDPVCIYEPIEFSTEELKMRGKIFRQISDEGLWFGNSLNGERIGYVRIGARHFFDSWEELSIMFSLCGISTIGTTNIRIVERKKKPVI